MRSAPGGVEGTAIGRLLQVQCRRELTRAELRSPGVKDPVETRRRLTAGRRECADLVEDLRRELDAVAESTSATPDDEHDAEGSTVGYERARVGALLAAAERHLLDYDAAVERLADGGYGVCARCGGPIGAERLSALPTAMTCVACAGR